MFLKKLFGKKADNSDFGKLMGGMIFLSKRTQEYFTPEEFEKLNPLELGLFFGGFNTACYLIIEQNPKESDMVKFSQHIVSMIVDNLDREKISNTPFENIQELRTAIFQHYTKRVDEYIDLIKIETRKPTGTGAFVDLTCGILNNLYVDEEPKADRYDMAFASLLANHMGTFGKIISDRR